MRAPLHIGDAAFYQGNCLAVLASLPDQSVQCCVTSPPYFGLRDYGHPDQIGLEDSPDAYVTKMVSVFRAVLRVLRDDGTCWINIGDSYSGSNASQGGDGSTSRLGPKATNADWTRSQQAMRTSGQIQTKRGNGLKPKDLIGIPWMIAFALRADGWYLRQDIIWAKPNPMPESVTDRCTKSHEYLFLLTKSARYFWDAEAMKETPVKGAAGSLFNAGKTATHQMGRSSDAERIDNETRNRRSVWTIATQPYAGAHFAVMPPKLVEPCILAGSRLGDTVLDPFSGSGTVGGVATGHGRRYLGIELSPDYLALSVERLRAAQRQPDLFHEAGKAAASSDLANQQSHN
jgi:DNA modification methylase